MEKTVIPIKELAQRWSCTEGYIYKLESKGVLTRTKLSKVCYPIKQVRALEMSEEEAPTLKEVREYKRRNDKLIKENEYLRKAINELTKLINGGNYDEY